MYGQISGRLGRISGFRFSHTLVKGAQGISGRHGLPAYTEEPVPAKRQNRMSARDMFRLVSYLLKVYPQITDITSLKSATLSTFS